jgi:hypothetical protein
MKFDENWNYTYEYNPELPGCTEEQLNYGRSGKYIEVGIVIDSNDHEHIIKSLKKIRNDRWFAFTTAPLSDLMNGVNLLSNGKVRTSIIFKPSRELCEHMDYIVDVIVRSCNGKVLHDYRKERHLKLVYSSKD